MAKVPRIKVNRLAFGGGHKDARILSSSRITRALSDYQDFYRPERDGVTFSLLSEWLTCREKSRLSLSSVTTRQTTLPLVFGTIVHNIIEVVYNEAIGGRRAPPTFDEVLELVGDQEVKWVEENPRASAEDTSDVELALGMAAGVLPVYFAHWSRDFTDRAWLHLEQEFQISVPIHYREPGWEEPSQIIPVRGKMDGVFGTKKKPWLFETKTRGQISPHVQDLLPMDMQVHIYLYALWMMHGLYPVGVLYNIIRRPQLRQKAGATTTAFIRRVAQDVQDRPDWYFTRFEMEVSKSEIVNFSAELVGMVEDFCRWWYLELGHYKNSGQCESRYGPCPMVPICGRNDVSGHYFRPRLFQELKDSI